MVRYDLPAACLNCILDADNTHSTECPCGRSKISPISDVAIWAHFQLDRWNRIMQKSTASPLRMRLKDSRCSRRGVPLWRNKRMEVGSSAWRPTQASCINEITRALLVLNDCRSSLLVNITHFIQEQSKHDFMKSLLLKNECIDQIRQYHQKLAASMASFQVSVACQFGHAHSNGSGRLDIGLHWHSALAKFECKC